MNTSAMSFWTRHGNCLFPFYLCHAKHTLFKLKSTLDSSMAVYLKCLSQKCFALVSLHNIIQIHNNVLWDLNNVMWNTGISFVLSSQPRKWNIPYLGIRCNIGDIHLYGKPVLFGYICIRMPSCSWCQTLKILDTRHFVENSSSPVW